MSLLHNINHGRVTAKTFSFLDQQWSETSTSRHDMAVTTSSAGVRVWWLLVVTATYLSIICCRCSCGIQWQCLKKKNINKLKCQKTNIQLITYLVVIDLSAPSHSDLSKEKTQVRCFQQHWDSWLSMKTISCYICSVLAFKLNKPLGIFKSERDVKHGYLGLGHQLLTLTWVIC